MTGHSTLDALADALELGAADYLLKPLDKSKLVEIISHAQRRRRRWQEALAGTLAAKHRHTPALATRRAHRHVAPS